MNMELKPNAAAKITGSKKYPEIYGWVRFYQTARGVLVKTEIRGLPHSGEKCGERVFGFHIHDGTSCREGENGDFPDSGAHFNPYGCPHPQHAGDLPPLFGNGGLALSAFLTDRFTVDEVIGKAVIIHAMPDDMITQPSGNSGEKIACGIIMAKE